LRDTCERGASETKYDAPERFTSLSSDSAERRSERLDFLVRALEEIDFGGLCLVELARHSHMAPEMAKSSIEFLRDATS